ncbi:MAG TPA: PAS domain-containing sensor histidine kinase [Dongiaceae bacterium]|nr:PAS domain-containing sensor histidine kinase [Dongiaceae bacterium]
MALTDTTPGPAEDEISRLLRTSSLVPLTIAAWDSGALIHASAAAAAMIGIALDALRGRSMLEFYVDPEQRHALLRAIEAGGGEAEGEVQLRRADGRQIWVKVAARRMTYGGVPCVLAIGQDITEQKDLAAALAETQEQLRRQASNLNLDERAAAQAASRAKSAFLAHMSHELRSPLNAILGFSELIRGLHFGREQVEKYAEYSGYIHQAGTHLLALIDDVLDLAKVEAGKLDLKPSSFDLAELLDECARMMRPMVEGRSVALRVTGSAAGLTLTADRRRAKQMIINLLSNAIKFTQTGGLVEMAGQRMADGAIAITVADTGIGMSEEQIAVALEPFGRVEGASIKDPTGTGLGLPIVKNLIEAHGGRLQIRSQLKRGTIARLVFPAKD